MEKLNIDIAYHNDGALAADLGSIIEQAKGVAYRAVDVVLVYRNWLIGKRIAEEELKGEARAEYGKETMAALAVELTEKYGAGFDFGSLYKYLAFFKRFKILDSLRPKSGSPIRTSGRWTCMCGCKISSNAAKMTIRRWESCSAPIRIPTSRSIRYSTATSSSSRPSIGYVFRLTPSCARRSRHRSRFSSSSTKRIRNGGVDNHRAVPLDHIIITDKSNYSFADNGRLCDKSATNAALQ